MIKQDAVRLVLEDGKKYKEAAKELGVPYRFVYRWVWDHCKEQKVPLPKDAAILRREMPELKAEAIRLVIEDGKKCAAVAREMGLPHISVYDWVKAHCKKRGIPRPDRLRLIRKNKEEAIRLVVEDGQDCAEVAKTLGVVGGTVFEWLAEYYYYSRQVTATTGYKCRPVESKIVRLALIENKKCSEVAEELGLLELAVSRVVDKYRQRWAAERPKYIGKRYDLRDKAIRLVIEDGKKCAAVAREMGLPYISVYDWVKAHCKKRGIPVPRPCACSLEDKRVRQSEYSRRWRAARAERKVLRHTKAVLHP